MIPKLLSPLRKLLPFIILGVLLCETQTGKPDLRSAQAATIDTVCRFGITSPLGTEGYDIANIGVGSYLDWGAVSNPNLPDGDEYIHVLRLRDDLYPQTLANLHDWVLTNIGSIWVVGNEPDTTYENQDALLPEIYADRYFVVATIIRNLDPSAKIGFGSVVQPTPIRRRYLRRAWDELVVIADGADKASELIDIWSIHSFILNEQEGYWGTGIPPGLDDYGWEAIIITDLTETYSISIFQQRIIDFRTWMKDIGEQNKPLWITEYGSLLPPIDPPGGPDYVNVSDVDTASFMLATFDFMLSATDIQTGFPNDGNKLVQRWLWYSLNDHRYNFGGSIFDPDNGKALTLVGQAFRDYQPLNYAQPDLSPMSLSATPASYNHDHTLVNYLLIVKIGNALTANTSSSAQVWIHDGDPNQGGMLIAGPISSEAIQRCGGTEKIIVYWREALPLTQHTLYVHVYSGADPNHTNDWANYSVYLSLPGFHFLPLVYH